MSLGGRAVGEIAIGRAGEFGIGRVGRANLGGRDLGRRAGGRGQNLGERNLGGRAGEIWVGEFGK